MRNAGPSSGLHESPVMVSREMSRENSHEGTVLRPEQFANPVRSLPGFWEVGADKRSARPPPRLRNPPGLVRRAYESRQAPAVGLSKDSTLRPHLEHPNLHR